MFCKKPWFSKANIFFSISFLLFHLPKILSYRISHNALFLVCTYHQWKSLPTKSTSIFNRTFLSIQFLIFNSISGLNDFKSPSMTTPSPASAATSLNSGEKPAKKKRKRCGECVGCQKKDNCGDCAPCRNDKSHQICKVRRCERLTEKKVRKVNVSHYGRKYVYYRLNVRLQ